MTTTDKIDMCIQMLVICKEQAKSVPVKRNKVLITDINIDSFNFVINQTISVLHELKKLQSENKRLSRDLNDLQRFCMNYAADYQDIDFPNSSKEPKSSDDIFFN